MKNLRKKLKANVITVVHWNILTKNSTNLIFGKRLYILNSNVKIKKYFF